jgi:hypothetical protein
MKKNKSSGSDGLPCQFYQAFWNDIKHFYYYTLQGVFPKKYYDIFTKIIFNYPDIQKRRPSMSKKLKTYQPH